MKPDSIQPPPRLPVDLLRDTEDCLRRAAIALEDLLGRDPRAAPEPVTPPVAAATCDRVAELAGR